ncbi:MAG: hypothetical protein Roseis2KO_33940 [Roseivirga sp.]
MIGPFKLNASRQVQDTASLQVHAKSKEFFEKGVYDSALYYLAKSRSLHSEMNNWQGLLDGTILTARVYVMQARLAEAAKEAELAVTIADKHFEENDMANARAQHLTGGISMARGVFPAAMESFQQALSIYKQGDWQHKPEVGTLYHDMGSLYVYMGDLQSALRYYLLGLELRTAILEDSHIDIVSSYESIGVVYAQKFEFEKALEAFLKAMNMVEKSFGNDHPKLARSLSNTANVYTLMGHTTLALEYLERALAIMRISFPEAHPNISLIRMNIGIAHMHEGRNTLAMQQFQKALSIQRSVFGEEHYIVAKSLDNVGIIHRKEKRYDSGLEFFEKALAIRKSLFGLNHPDVANSFQNIGELYTEMSDKLAIRYLEQAAEIRERVLGPFHPDVANAYDQLGTYYQSAGDLKSALNAYQNALFVNVSGFQPDSLYKHPDISEYREGNMLLASLGAKADALVKLYEQTADLRNLEFAQETYKLCHRLIDENRQKRMRHEDKLLLGNISKSVYQGAVETSYALAGITGNRSYEVDAFLFAERSKAAVLFENLSRSQAKQFSGLPDSLLSKEQTLKSDQSYYQSQLLNLNAARRGDQNKAFNELRENLFDTNEALDDLRKLLEQRYPKYYQLMYQNKILSPKEVQAMLSMDQVLVEYFESESRMFLFTITADSFRVKSFDKDPEYRLMMEQYIRSFQPEAARTDFARQFDQFREASSFLYQQLLLPALSGLSQPGDRLIIVPTEALAYVPLELLVDSNVQASGTEDYKSLEYMLKRYAVSYAPSASLVLQPQIGTTSLGRSSLLAFAPDYTGKAGPLAKSNLPQGLKWNTIELDEISQYVSGDYFKGKEATEGLFKKIAGDHSILHLAMHAFVDEEEPMQSRLVFSQDADSTEDGMLYAYELFNMELPADMVVLSACNTGLGKVEEGEGMMSLGRAFFYAGSPSIIASSWAVDDQSTSKLMGLFYKYIAEGKTKDRALQQARIDFLETGNGIKTHPYYWAGFAVIGNTDALPAQAEASMPVTVLLIAGFMVLVFVVLRNRRAA